MGNESIAANINLMHETSYGFDAIIVVSSTQEQADFWEHKLKNSELLVGRKLYSVVEEWGGGAGQLLGTLNAWKEACKLADLDEMIKEGGSVAIYHTAGKGTRIAPVGLSEVDKGAVRLPMLVEYADGQDAITLLEAVIHQTSIFAASRKGRICVFWGDQIFIPARDIEYDGTHHVELFSIREGAPESEEDWKAGWESYGLIIPKGEESVLREKQSWEEFNRLVEKGVIRPVTSGKIIAGKSMGCFSVSYEFFKALLEEYKTELIEQKQKLDVDPHMWMPLTSAKEDFDDKDLWDMVNRFKQNFLAKDASGLLLFGDKDLGRETYWWDFGQLHLYYSNLLKLVEDSDEGEAMRAFFKLEEQFIKDAKFDGLEVKDSILLDSDVRGNLNRCILINIASKHLDSDNSVMINSRINRGEIKQSVVYNCIELCNLETGSGDVVAELFHPLKGKLRMETRLERDGKHDWELRVQPNYHSYAEAQMLMKEQKLDDIKAERSRWENYFSSDLGEHLDSLKNSFIRPLDTLVEKAWGGSQIEELKQIPPSGRAIGESWECSAHPGNSSNTKVNGMEVPLTHLLNHAGREILGDKMDSQFKGELPILLKFIDSRENLSVQVHPSDEWAGKLGEKDSGKNEAWLILRAEPDSRLYIGWNQRADDLSSFSIDQLNSIEPEPGDVYMIPAGTVHAIGVGILLFEIQQSSDLTYRIWDWDRVPERPLHLGKAAQCLNFEPSEIKEFKSTPRQLSPHETILADTMYFTLSSIKIGKGDSIEQSTEGRFRILTCVKGEVRISAEDEHEVLHQGQSLLVPASLTSYQISSSSDAVILKSWRC